jgi:glycosyltransferase involved in cell wall biosynthesis
MIGPSMLRKGKVLVDLGKLRNLEVGLGEVSRRFGEELGRQLDAGAAADLAVDLLVPPAFHRRFGREARTRKIRAHHRLLPVGGEYDVWHELHQDSSLRPASRRSRLLLTIHDLNFLYEKEPAKARRLLQRLQRKVDRSTVVTAISQFTANEVRAHLHLKGRPIEVIPNGVPDVSAAPALRPAFLPKGRPFLFTVCHLTAKKNVHVLLDLAKLASDRLFVLAGDRETPYGRMLARRIEDERIPNVLLPGKVSDEEKNWLHQSAEGFLFPSLYEGFGLPVVEAMSCGKPVFTSRATALPEIAGDGGFFFKTFEPAGMEKTLREGLDAFRADPVGCAERARRNASRFRWDATVRRYLDLYRRLAGLPVPTARTGEAIVVKSRMLQLCRSDRSVPYCSPSPFSSVRPCRPLRPLRP